MHKIEYRSAPLWNLMQTPEARGMTAEMEAHGIKALHRRGLWGLLITEDAKGLDVQSGILFLGRN